VGDDHLRPDTAAGHAWPHLRSPVTADLPHSPSARTARHMPQRGRGVQDHRPTRRQYRRLPAHSHRRPVQEIKVWPTHTSVDAPVRTGRSCVSLAVLRAPSDYCSQASSRCAVTSRSPWPCPSGPGFPCAARKRRHTSAECRHERCCSFGRAAPLTPELPRVSV
jgi:hypothetical protein